MEDPGKHTEEPLETQEGFGFGFNDSSFSDRVLRIEIMSESVDYKCNMKRGREVLEEENGDEAGSSNDTKCSPAVEVKTLHISSIILAAKSPFFYKLFKNGMIESQQRHVTFKIKASEEASLMEVLRFMYSNTLSAVTASELVGVLIAADKFEVPSCVRYCSKMIQKLPMSLESALLYLDLPSSLLVNDAINQLIDATKEYLVARYRDMTKSEDDILAFILKWARARYPNQEERREIIGKNLLRLIRFPYLSCPKLKDVRVNPEFDHGQVCKLVTDAFFYKTEGRRGPSSASCQERSYEGRPVKVVWFEMSRPRCVVYFELKRQDCVGMLHNRTGLLDSETFQLGGRRVVLRPLCYQSRSKPYHFGLLVIMSKCSGETCRLDFGISVMEKPLEEFQSMYRVKNYSALLRHDMLRIGKNDLVPWFHFVSDNSDYFVDGILHLRLEFTFRDKRPLMQPNVIARET